MLLPGFCNIQCNICTVYNAYYYEKSRKLPQGSSSSVNRRTKQNNGLKEKKSKSDNIMAIRKRTNNDLQYTTQKTKDRATQILLKIEDETQVFRNVDTYKWKIHNGTI